MKYCTNLSLLSLLSLTSICQINKSDTLERETIICIFENIQAGFPGGHNAMLKFFEKNLTYPKKAKKQKEDGTVFIRFCVQKDGSLSEFSVVKNASQLLDREALRVARLMPKWNPAITQGRVINIFMKIPITFKL